jgi:hypothetical protein
MWRYYCERAIQIPDQGTCFLGGAFGGGGAAVDLGDLAFARVYVCVFSQVKATSELTDLTQRRAQYGRVADHNHNAAECALLRKQGSS